MKLNIKNIILEKFTDELTTSDIGKLLLNEAEKFNYDEEVKLLDRNSSIYEYIDIFSQPSEVLSSEINVFQVKQQKSILDRLILDENLTKMKRLIVLIKLKRVK